jgi:hypothetical protein
MKWGKLFLAIKEKVDYSINISAGKELINFSSIF